MAKTNWQDPKTSEMRSTHVSGLQEAVGKLEESIGMESVYETNVPLTEVFISSDDRYRIFQAPEGKRNWTAEQAPVIKRNGSIITSGFEIDYGGGAIVLNVNDTVANTYTADVTYIKIGKIPKSARFVIGTSTSGWTEKDCDYLCDGTADQVEINNAIQALPATGGEIVILDGIYNITNRIDVSKSNTVIRGNGKSTILLRKFDSPSSPKYVIGPTANDITIRDITIDGNVSAYSGQYNGGVGTANQSNHRFQVINVTLIDILDSGISIRGDNNVIRDCTSVNCKFGISTGSQRDVLIIGNILKDCDTGIRLMATKGGIVSNNICVRGLGTPEDYTSIQNTILLYGSSNTNLLISSNLCMGKAPVVEGGTGNTLVNNKFDAS